MKIKVIDLLNAIAEGKELPKEFMYKGHLYYRQKTKGICYRCDELNEIFEECLVLEDLKKEKILKPQSDINGYKYVR